MSTPLSRQPGSHYLLSPARTLYDACHEAGRDGDGAVCPVCGLRDICDADRARTACRGAAAAVTTQQQ